MNTDAQQELPESGTSLPAARESSGEKKMGMKLAWEKDEGRVGGEGGQSGNKRERIEIHLKVNLRFDCSGLLLLYVYTGGYLRESSKISLRFAAENKATEMDNVSITKDFKK